MQRHQLKPRLLEVVEVSDAKGLENDAPRAHFVVVAAAVPAEAAEDDARVRAGHDRDAGDPGLELEARGVGS